MRFSTPNVRFFTPMEVHQPFAQVFLFKGEPENVPSHKLVRICLNTSCIRVPKRSFLAPVVFELYRVAGKCDRSPRSTLPNISKEVHWAVRLSVCPKKFFQYFSFNFRSTSKSSTSIDSSRHDEQDVESRFSNLISVRL